MRQHTIAACVTVLAGMGTLALAAGCEPQRQAYDTEAYQSRYMQPEAQQEPVQQSQPQPQSPPVQPRQESDDDQSPQLPSQ